MTDNEFKDNLQKLLNKLPEDRNVLVLMYDQDTKTNVIVTGTGCLACALEIAKYIYENENIEHNRDNNDTLH